MGTEATTVVTDLLNAFNERDWTGMRATLSEQIEYNDIPTGLVLRTPDDFVGWISEAFDPFPDAMIEDVRLFESGNTVISTFVERAKHLGPLEGPDGVIEPTGREVLWPLCCTWEIDEMGRIAGGAAYYDQMAPLLQLDVWGGP